MIDFPPVIKIFGTEKVAICGFSESGFVEHEKRSNMPKIFKPGQKSSLGDPWAFSFDHRACSEPSSFLLKRKISINFSPYLIYEN